MGACELILTWRDERLAAMAEMGIVVAIPSFFFSLHNLFNYLSKVLPELTANFFLFLNKQQENTPVLVSPIFFYSAYILSQLAFLLPPRPPLPSKGTETEYIYIY